ncbi:lipase family protein [Streptomyces boncukensis]|uniref:Lipase n=1 Tax=Streptomyces boncukensis TaxID=2711219 RepID=A0A6G4WR85_9ACTN|nr:lipase family protein [Streptomyces boncukensis]NGO67715.1 lipase [Streptomyces boncukensis]
MQALFTRPTVRGALALLLAAAVWATTAGAAAPAPPGSAALPPDDFYEPPDPLPAGKPGDVIRARKIEPAQPTPRRLADTWQVMFRSTDALGEPSAVTGTVLVPRGTDPAAAPVVGWGPGTQGPAFRCTPSRMIAKGALYEQWVLNGMLRAGYAIAVTDYEGYRPRPDTSYVVGKAMGPALIDTVRAAQRLPEAGLSAEAPVAFRGYSQGGGAALWAGEFQPEYAPELKLTGIVAGGVPADLVGVALALNGQPGSGFLLNALLGLDNAYPELDLDASLNDAGRAAFAALEEDACALELINDYGGKRLADYTTRSPLADPAWVARYTENTLGPGTALDVPVLQYHATQDGLVAYGQAERLHEQYCAQGVRLTWKTYDTGGRAPVEDHLWPIQAADRESLDYLADRFAGREPEAACTAP